MESIINSDISILLAAWGAVIVACLSPGPNSVVVASTAYKKGTIPALYVVMGVATGAFIWLVLALFGLTAVFNSAPYLLDIISVLGGAYLMFLSYKSAAQVFKKKEEALSLIRSSKNGYSYFIGLISALTNPKSTLFWFSISITMEPLLSSFPLVVLFIAVATSLVFFIYMGVGLFFSNPITQPLLQKYQLVTSIVFSLMFALLALGLIARPFLT